LCLKLISPKGIPSLIGGKQGRGCGHGEIAIFEKGGNTHKKKRTGLGWKQFANPGEFLEEVRMFTTKFLIAAYGKGARCIKEAGLHPSRNLSQEKGVYMTGRREKKLTHRGGWPRHQVFISLNKKK